MKKVAQKKRKKPIPMGPLLIVAVALGFAAGITICWLTYVVLVNPPA